MTQIVADVCVHLALKERTVVVSLNLESSYGDEFY